MIPLGIIWSGYTLIFYGYCLIKGPGLGLTDLIKPSGVAKVDAFLSGSPTGPISVPGSSGTGPGFTNPSTGQYVGPKAPDGTPLIPPGTPVA
jgi:hypothetical protein